MYRDPTFQEPFETLPQRDLLALARLSGRRCLRSKWAFLALLPEIDRRSAFKREGFVSLFDYARRKGGISVREVQEVLNLHKLIGRYWVLWRLLAMGAVGMSKFQRVAKWVTPENAAWWAEQLVKCTRAQLDALIARLGAQGGDAEGDGSQESLPPMEPETARVPEESIRSSCEVRPPVDSLGLNGLSYPLEDDRAEGRSHMPLPEAGPAPRQVDRPEVISLKLSAYGAKALHDLQALVERSEGAISVGQLIERLVFDALSRGAVAAGPSRAKDRPPEPPQVRLPPRRFLQVIYRNQDTGASWIPSGTGPIPFESVPPAEQVALSEAEPVLFAELRAKALAAKVRHSRAIAGKRKAGGPLPSDDGRHIPAAIEVYLLGRSGGLCEINGCRKRVDHIHHCDPYSEHHTHDPDRMLAICSTCHDDIHGELAVPDKVDPRVLHPVVPGQAFERSAVSEGFLDNKMAG